MLFTLSLADVSIEKTFSKQFLRKFKITLFFWFCTNKRFVNWNEINHFDSEINENELNSYYSKDQYHRSKLL